MSDYDTGMKRGAKCWATPTWTAQLPTADVDTANDPSHQSLAVDRLAYGKRQPRFPSFNLRTRALWDPDTGSLYLPFPQMRSAKCRKW